MTDPEAPWRPLFERNSPLVAEAAVHEAMTMVQWCTAGIVRAAS